MPGCTLEREVDGGTARYRVSGKFEGACAWELARRLQEEPLHLVVVDFSQVSDFVDYGIAVLSSAMLTMDKRIELRGLRQHQERVFRYFGVEPAAASRDAELPLASAPVAAREVH
jgi:hypothetical protein